MEDTVVLIKNVHKQYRLGTIGGGTLSADLQSWWAKKRGKENPNLKIGEREYRNDTFMALNGVNLKINKGDTVGIIGGNGAGKSTLLKILSRVTAPTVGEIYIKGRIASMLEVGTGFHPELTGRENIYLNGAILGMSKAEVDSKIEEIIDFSECRKFIDTPVKRYSSGMYVKLAFAVSAHLDSEILVMDEVLAVGDMKFQQKCLDKMSKVAKEEGKAVLYVSHNMNTVRQLCNRCIVLDKGEVKYDGNTEEAIQIYLDNYLETLPYINLEGIKRDDYLGFNLKCKMKSCQMITGENGVISNREKLKFELEWMNYDTIEGLKLRIEFKVLNEVVATAFLEDELRCSKNTTTKKCFEVDIKELVPSLYETIFVLYKENEWGYSVDYDCVNSICFEKKVDNKEFISWNTKAWGYIKLNNIQVLL